jgi:hypothetical protein
MPTLAAVLEESAYNELSDETVKSFYVQNTETNKYYAQIDNPDVLAVNSQAEITKFRDLLEKNQTANKELANKFKPFESLGKTPEEIKQLLESNRPEELKQLVEKYETEKQQLQSSLNEALEKETSARTTLEKQYASTLINVDINKLVIENDLDPEYAPLVLSQYLKPVKNEETGEWSTRIYKNGQPALVAMQPMTATQLLKEFVDGKQHLKMFNAPNGGGSGASNRQGGIGNGKVMKRSQFDGLSLENPAAVGKFLSDGGKVIDD